MREASSPPRGDATIPMRLLRPNMSPIMEMSQPWVSTSHMLRKPVVMLPPNLLTPAEVRYIAMFLVSKLVASSGSGSGS